MDQDREEVTHPLDLIKLGSHNVLTFTSVIWVVIVKLGWSQVEYRFNDNLGKCMTYFFSRF